MYFRADVLVNGYSIPPPMPLKNEKELSSKKLQQQIDKFLAGGGQIEKIANGVSGTNKLLDGYPQEANQKNQKARSGGQKKAIVGINITTNEQIYFESAVEAAAKGFSKHLISECCNGKRHNYAGYRWVFVKDLKEFLIK